MAFHANAAVVRIEVVQAPGIILRRDLRLALRQTADNGMAVGFFVLTVILFPLGVGPEPAVLARVAPGILWVTALLASMLSLERLFAADYEDGSLDLMALAPLPLPLLVLTKCLAHWLLTGLPMVVLAPLLGLLLNLDPAGYGAAVLEKPADRKSGTDKCRHCRGNKEMGR